jgi:alpha-tubulin suppressor-like RCC1 family protein
MSQSKAQLTNPLGTVDLSGLNATGVVTATSFKGDGTALTGIALTGNINTTGIITAGKFYGSGANLTGVGLGTQSSINTTGIITAGKFYGDGSGLTNIGGAFTVLTYQPSIGSTNVGLTTNIILTFNKSIKRGSGTITLRTGSASGTIVESYDASISGNLNINGGVLTINPSNDLVGLTTYFMVIPAGTIKDVYGADNNTLIDTYSFITGSSNAELYTIGSNEYGQIGDNVAHTIHRSSPRQIPGTQWSYCSEESFGTLFGLKNDGTLWLWGYNPSGQLGLNDLANRSSPAQVPGTQWSSDAALGNYSVLVRKTDGTLWAWGSNAYGHLGQNNLVNRSSPIQVPGTNWSKLSGGYVSGATYGLKTDGTLWVWGKNNSGQLGLNLPAGDDRSSPTQLPGTQWSDINGGRLQVLALKTDGTLWSWGLNSNGFLGVNDRVTRSSPIQVPGTQWATISASNYISGATKTDGTLWTWGQNNVGQLGHNSTTYYSSPVQIPGTQWASFSATYWGGRARKTDNTLWSWGYNNYGQLGGDFATAARSSPIQIPGTQWSFVGESNYTSCALKQV